jgi:uncharacterized protein YoxC
MESIIKSDIFFTISSVSVIIITVLIIVASFYLIKILKNVSEISTKTNQTVEDVRATARNIKRMLPAIPVIRALLRKKERKHKE